MVIWIWTFPFLENWQFNHKLGLPLFYKHTVPDPAGIYLLKVNNGKSRTKVWNAFKVNNEDTKTTSGIVLVSLLLALNIFHTFFLVFLLLTLNMYLPAGWKTILAIQQSTNSMQLQKSRFLNSLVNWE